MNPTQQPEHCKSEGRCIDFTFAPKEWHGNDNQCLLCGCDGDTRTRPHTPLAPEEPELPDDYWHCPFRKDREECASWCEWPCDDWAQWHDAAIARAATLATLDKFQVVEQMHDVEDVSYPDLYNEFIKIYKSLHTAQEQQR